MMKSFETFTKQHRFYSLDVHMKLRFNSKVFKVALNGDFSCPNRDGTISSSGCIFCSALGSGEFAGKKNDSLEKQFNSVKTDIHKKWPAAKYMVYFQANSNTYGPLSKIEPLFEKAIKLDKDIVGISIATRPDCLPDEMIDYLADLNKRIPVWVELGLQTMHDATATLINRGYNLSVFEKAYQQLRSHGIEVIVHIINGLPYETEKMMIATIEYLNKLDIQGIKIHSLFILKETKLEQLYDEKIFEPLRFDQFIQITTEQIAHLRKDIVIHRLTGDAPADLLVAPLWSLKKFVVINEIDKMLRAKNYFQGCKMGKENKMDFYELILKRESCRNFNPKIKVALEMLEQICEAGRLAPSACNSQPWSFHIVCEPKKVENIQKATQILGINASTADVQSFIIINEEKGKMNERIGQKFPDQEFSSIDIGIATAHMVLCATSLGISTCIIGAFDSDIVKRTMEWNPPTKIRLILAIGYSLDTVSKPKYRKNKPDVIKTYS